MRNRGENFEWGGNLWSDGPVVSEAFCRCRIFKVKLKRKLNLKQKLRNEKGKEQELPRDRLATLMETYLDEVHPISLPKRMLTDLPERRL